MKKSRLLILPLYFTILSCKYDVLFHAQEAEARTSVMSSDGTLEQNELQVLSENVIRLAEADLKSTFAGKLLAGASQSFSYPGLQGLLQQNDTCTHTSLSKRSDNVTESFIELDCAKIKGTKEVRNVKSDEQRVFESSSSLTIFDKESSYELKERSFLTVEPSGEFRLEKEFSDLKKEAFSQSEIAGSLNYESEGDGELELNGTASLYQEATAVRAFIIQGKGLHHSACGIDRGTIEFTANKHKLTVIFYTCGRHSALARP